MGVAYAAEVGLLAENEREPILRSHYPILETLSLEETRELARWLRERRDRARDILYERGRARRGRGTPRGAPSDPDTARHMANKKQVYARALKRVNARLDLLTGELRRARNAERLRAALARKRAAEPPHPAPGVSASAGMAPKPSRKRPGIIMGQRIGSVSQATRNRQAARDARH